MRNDQKGFSAIEILLILVIAGLVGFIGWYVWDAKNNANSSLNNANKSNLTIAKPPVQKKATTSALQACTTKDLSIANYQSVTSATGRFTVNIPGGWNINNWTTQDYLYAGGINDIKYSSSTKPNVTNGDTSPSEGGATRRFSMQAVDIKDKANVGSETGTPCSLVSTSGVNIKRFMTDMTPESDPQSGVQYAYYVYYTESSNNILRTSYSVVKGETDQVSLIDSVVKSARLK